MSQMIRFCPECGDDRLFESYHGEPGGCPDSPDGDCPEWGCVACGTALLIGLAVVVIFKPGGDIHATAATLDAKSIAESRCG